jgi:hypothetical protein
MVRWLAVLGIVLACIGALLAGCAPALVAPGGDPGAGGPEGRFSFAVAWPEATAKMIPAAAASIRVSVLETASASELASLLLTPGSPRGTTGKLPAGVACTIRATAHPNADGSGTPQAGASVEETVPRGATKPVLLTLASNIVSVGVSPDPSVISVGATAPFTATAYDALGAVVLVSASGWTWASGDSAIAGVTAAGVVSGVGLGTTSITATENETGSSGSAAVTVTPVPVLTVDPTTLAFGSGLTDMTLTVRNTGGGTLTWSCAPSAAWITLAPGSGTNDGAVIVSVSRAGLTPGPHTGTVTVTSNAGTVVVQVTATVDPPRFFDHFDAFGTAWTPIPLLSWPVGTKTFNEGSFATQASWVMGTGFGDWAGWVHAQYGRDLPVTVPSTSDVTATTVLKVVGDTAKHGAMNVLFLTATNGIAAWAKWENPGVGAYTFSAVTNNANAATVIYTAAGDPDPAVKMTLKRVGGTWHAYLDDVEVGVPVASTFTGTIARIALVAAREGGLPPVDVRLDYVDVTMP